MRIALTGGIACGKSLVARYLNELGVETIDADDIVHELIPDPAERKRLAAEVFADPEKRKALEAKLHPLVKEELNRRIVESSDCRKRGDDRTAAVLSGSSGREDSCSSARESTGSTGESTGSTGHSVIRSSSSPFPVPCSPRIAIIPLLFETHWDSDYDIICCVRSARATQIARMMDTRGYTREEAEARLAAQMPVEEKAEKSHYVIENDGSAEELKKEVKQFVSWLREMHSGSE